MRGTNLSRDTDCCKTERRAVGIHFSFRDLEGERPHDVYAKRKGRVLWQFQLNRYMNKKHASILFGSCVPSLEERSIEGESETREKTTAPTPERRETTTSRSTPLCPV